MKKGIRKTFSVILVVLLLFGRLGFSVVLAGESGQEVDNVANLENEVDSEANTGENSIGEEGEPEEDPQTTEEPGPSAPPSPTPAGSPPPSPSPTPEAGLDNEAEIENDIDSTAITGENLIEGPSPSPSPTPTASPSVEPDESPSPSPAPEIDTGDAVSIVEVENLVNSTVIESEVVFHTLNIFVPQGQDIDLNTTPQAIANSVFDGENQNAVVNVSVVDIDNFAYLSNDIVSFANTGLNSIEGAAQAEISTGDAYSVVSLFNRVNTSIINSTLHLITINVFGNIEANILLPELEPQDACCGEAVQINNDAVIENNVDSTAISGQNSVVTAQSASITTGSAASVVNVVNLVNKSFVGTVFHYLTINTLGNWLGNFLGWDDFEAAEGGGSLSLNSTEAGSGDGDCPTCAGDVSIGNEALVTNNVDSGANTGGNFIEGEGGEIVTGSAYSSVSIFNLVNTSIVNSTGFLGFINIFGFLEGAIGGASLFVEEIEADLDEEGPPLSQDSGGPTQLAGGEIDVYQENNVGTHVLPGDTVTFFVTARNPGTGPVYGAELRIGLINEEGTDLGGASYDLGDIEAGKGVKVTTGITLSEDAAAGDYMAHAVVTGHIGPDDDLISTYSDSFLTIVGSVLSPILPGLVEEIRASEPSGEVFGANTQAGLTQVQRLEILLLALLLVYLPPKGYQKRKELAVAFRSVRTFLTSFLT